MPMVELRKIKITKLLLTNF